MVKIHTYVPFTPRMYFDVTKVTHTSGIYSKETPGKISNLVIRLIIALQCYIYNHIDLFTLM